MSNLSEESKISVAHRYLQLANDRNLDEMFKLYEQDAIYEMQSTPPEPAITFTDLDSIKDMTLKYFNTVPSDVSWEVEQKHQVDNGFEPDLSVKKNYKEGDAVVTDLKQTTVVAGKSSTRRMREWVCVNERGKIYHVKLINLP